MAVRVAINGFGRIGRLAFRQMFEADGYEGAAHDRGKEVYHRCLICLNTMRKCRPDAKHAAQI